MLSAFTNCFKIPELRQRIFLTLGLIFIARVGAGIPLPGIDPAPLQAFYASSSSDGGGLVGLYNMFTGGAMVNGALFALGIMPYISASIILQLMGAVMPSLARLMQEGDSGRQKIAQYTRYLTLVIAAIQGTMLIYALVYSPETIFTGFDKAQYGSILIAGNIPVFFITSVFFMTTGCMILTWLGEQITQRGVGNGVSIIITVGIIETLPGAVSQAYQLVFNRAVGAESAGIGMPQAVMMLVLLVVVTVAIIMILQAVRKVPVQYAKRLVGRKLMGGQSSYLPLKVNYAGVMPIIFASAILLFPQQIFGALVTEKVRSLGAKLVNCDGKVFMHPLETRDVAAASIIRECTDRNKGVDTGSGKAVWLDTPMIERIGGEGTIEARIPAMLRMFMNHGIDIRREPILVFPTLHYQNGGLDINVDGMTPNVPNLYVAGEAVGGIHGRNRLMGNSLLDIIVFGRSAGRNAAHRAAETVPAKLTLNHVAEFEAQLNAAGIETEAVSPKLLPDYRRK